MPGLRSERVQIKWSHLTGKKSRRAEKMAQVLFEKKPSAFLKRGMEFPDPRHNLGTETGTVEHSEMTDLILQIVRFH